MSTDPKRCYIKRVEGVRPTHKRQPYFFIIIMTAVATLPRDVMVGMLRKGETGNDILNILEVIAPTTDDQVSEDLNTENDDEIATEV